MAEIERFTLRVHKVAGTYAPRAIAESEGDFIRFSDHERALAEARQSERQRVRGRLGPILERVTPGKLRDELEAALDSLEAEDG